MKPHAIQDAYPDEIAVCYGCGRHNPRGLHIKTYWDGKEGLFHFQPEPYHTAFPGVVYGGLIASLIDCHSIGTAVAAAYQAEGRQPGTTPEITYVTGNLNVTYLNPTPIGDELVLKSQVKQMGPRKTIVVCSLYAHDTKCARAEVTAIRISSRLDPGAGGSDSGTVINQRSLAAGKGTGQASQTLPADIYPESGCRLPLPKKEDMDKAGQTIYDKLTGSRKRVLAGLTGPSAIRLHIPELAEKANALSQHLRYQSGLSGSIRELAILVTAREMDSRFEWAAHEPKAREEGISPDVIDVIRHRRDVAGLPEDEAVIIQLGRQLFGRKKVNSKTFARALKVFGSKKLVVLVSLMAHYSSTAVLLSAFDMQLGPDQKVLLPLTE